VKYDRFKNTPVLRILKNKVPNFIKFIVIWVFSQKLIRWIVVRQSQTLRRVRYDLKSVPSDCVAPIYLGVWESAEIYMARKYLAGEEFVIECGASLGVVAASFLTGNADCREYLAIEANPGTFQTLVRQMKAYPVVKCINVAVAYPAGYVEFAATSILGGRVATNNSIADKSKSFLVQGSELRTIVSGGALGELPQSFSLILDIEGAEGDIFSQDTAFVQRANFIVCELEDTERYSIDEQICKLDEIGFDLLERFDNVMAFKSRH
jgi:FkbM family methyltransferase